jgi:hypothetical protein
MREEKLVASPVLGNDLTNFSTRYFSGTRVSEKADPGELHYQEMFMRIDFMNPAVQASPTFWEMMVRSIVHDRSYLCTMIVLW